MNHESHPAWRNLEEQGASERQKLEVGYAQCQKEPQECDRNAILQSAIAKIAEMNQRNQHMNARLQAKEAKDSRLALSRPVHEDESQHQLSLQKLADATAELADTKQELAATKAELAQAKVEISRLENAQEKQTDDLIQALVADAKRAAREETLLEAQALVADSKRAAREETLREVAAQRNVEMAAERNDAEAGDRELLHKLTSRLEDHFVAVNSSAAANAADLKALESPRLSWREACGQLVQQASQALVGSADSRDATSQQQQHEPCCNPLRLHLARVMALFENSRAVAGKRDTQAKTKGHAHASKNAVPLPVVGG